MPPKKAAKKVAKKAAKKAPGKKAHGKGRDLLRAYEHLGRVMVLVDRLNEEQVQAVHLLTAHAEERLHAGKSSDGAELLRAAEHLGFGFLALTVEPDTDVTEDLLEQVEERFEHLRERAAERGEDQDAPRKVLAVSKMATREAKAAKKAGRYRAALELIRAADALAQVEEFGDIKKRLPEPSTGLEKA